MAIEHDILPFIEWLLPRIGVRLGALGFFSVAVLVLIFSGILIGYLITAMRNGPTEAFYIVAKVISVAVGQDLPDFSLRRTLAIARLAIQEAIRRRVLIAFAVFIVLLLFAGWFLDVKSDHPARLYLGFVLTTANYMMFVVALFLSTFSLPNDIKNKTIYTVVTKPVRSGEIVLGRILGFSAIGTAMLLVMGGASYGFVVRGLAHRHEVNPAEMEKLVSGAGETSLAAKGRTSRNAHHSHELTIGADGRGQTDLQQGHWHEVTYDAQNNRYEVGPHQGMLLVRVPAYGKLSFLDRQGRPDTKGVSVGKEWTYRSYVEGASLATAIWSYNDITEQHYPDGLPLEMTLSVFRTHKGNIEKGVRGEIVLVNPSDKAKIRRSEPISFTAVEFAPYELFIPRKLKGVDNENKLRDIDLFNDLVSDGRLEIRVRCRDSGQYYGMAQPDLFLKRGDLSFAQNFVKAYTSIWLQLIMVTGFGVMFSTVLNAAVSLLTSISAIVLGYFGQFIADVATGTQEGGGPIESLIRILTQTNLSVDLDLGLAEKIIKWIDRIGLTVMQVFTQLLPNYETFNTASYVSYGFNIPFDAVLAKHFLVAGACLLLVTIIGYFGLKTREIGA